MQTKKKNQTLEKSKKKIYTFTLSPDNVKKLEDRMGYGSRSKIIDILISDFVDNKKESEIISSRQTLKTKIRHSRFSNV